MTAAAARNDSDAIPNKPPASTGTIQFPKVAYPGDVKDTDLSRTAKQVWVGLCEHRNRATGLSYPKVMTLVKELSIAERSVQRGLEELVRTGWIGTPFGDSGGASNRSKDNEDGTRHYSGVQYHLHPKGAPCLFCIASARTINRSRTPKSVYGGTLRATPKGAISRVPRVPKNTPKGAISDRAYKEGTFSKEPSLKREPTSTSAALPKAEHVDDAVVPSPSKNKPAKDTDKDAEKWKAALQARMAPGELIGADVWLKISQLRVSLPRFVFGFAKALPGRTKVGGIVQCVKDWDTLTADVEWPDCYDCEDTGVVYDSTSPFGHEGPCSCAAGEAARHTKFPKWQQHLAAMAAGTTFCITCEGTGIRPTSDADDYWRQVRGVHFCFCNQGVKAYGEARGKEKAEADRILALKEQGICPRCEGKLRSTDAAARCFDCRGTGRYYANEKDLETDNLCRACWGTRNEVFGKLSRTCSQCRGTGQWSKPIDTCRKR